MKPDETAPQAEPEDERPPDQEKDTEAAVAPRPTQDLFDLADAMRISSRFAAG